MRADTRIQSYSFNDLFTVKPSYLCISIQFIEKCNTHGKVGVCKQFDCLSFRKIGKECRDLLLDCPFLKKCGKCMCLVTLILRRSDNNTGRIQIIIQCMSFS